MVKIAPSILSADFTKLGEEIKKVENYVELLHVDVMDGHFVPNITFGPPIVESIRKITKLPLDVHLMIDNPDKFIDDFAAAGADIISVHFEAVSNIKKIIDQIKNNNAKAAIAINPVTPVTAISDVLEDVDMVLLMTVNPGFGSQKFIESVLPKIRGLREIIDSKKLKVEIEIDGGINAETAQLAISAGADILVAGSYIYRSKNPVTAIKLLRL